jgi:CubicO group peptidase (beta-lactamase class C family)
VSQGGFDTDLVLGPRVADHGWGMGYMLNQRGVNGHNPRIFGHGGLGGSFGFVDLEHRIGYAYVMNRYDATKARPVGFSTRGVQRPDIGRCLLSQVLLRP